MSEHEELRMLLGGHVLGGLSAEDRARLEVHLAHCAECRAELAGLAPLPGLLRRVPHEDQTATGVSGVVAPGPELGAALLARMREERSGRRRRLRWSSVAVAVSAVMVGMGLVLAALVAGLPVPGSGSSENPPQQAREVAAVVVLSPGLTGEVSAHGEVSLVTKGWGTAVELNARDLPVDAAAGPFRLQVIGADGVAELAATWGPTPAGKAVVSGATSMSPGAIRSVRVLGADGTVLAGRATAND